jgi:hypothetical protein
VALARRALHHGAHFRVAPALQPSGRVKDTARPRGAVQLGCAASERGGHGGPVAAPHLIDTRGIALPMSLFTLLVTSALALAFIALAQTEPTIASNQLRAAQARTLAESGIERALWALTHATEPGAFGGGGTPPNVTVAATPVAPYDGSVFIPVGVTGGVHVTVTGSDPHLRAVRATGWTPTSDPGDPRQKTRSEVIATLVRVPNLARDVPCALCLGGTATVAASTIDARGSDSSDCGGKVGLAGIGPLTVDASASILGAGAPSSGGAALEGRDWRVTTPPTLSADDLDTLRALAVVRGTYVRPASGTRETLHDIPAGIVFVDTPAGTNAVDATNTAEVVVGAGFAATPPFRGWLVVNGTVRLEAGAALEGVVYASDALVLEGPASVTGLVVARQLLGTPLTLSGLSLTFGCEAARANGLLPEGWFVRAGGYCDGTAGC